MSSLIGHEQGKAIVEEYDKGVVDQRVEEDKNLDNFEMTISTNEQTMELVNKELLIFKHYQMNIKNIKCALQWWEKHENMFPIVGFCAKQILGIVGSQIETKRIFSLTRILTSFKRCHLQSKNLDKLIFVNKNWPKDPIIGCKSPSNLVDLIEINLKSLKELLKGTKLWSCKF